MGHVALCPGEGDNPLQPSPAVRRQFFLADFPLEWVFTGEVTTESQALLADFAQNGSEAAFRELVDRYIGLVYSTALRLLGGDAHRAQDVAQTVFIDLAQQAAKLSKDSMLGGWLHRDTCFVAAKLMRGERRRQNWERQAAEMNTLNNAERNLDNLSQVLDASINELADADRKAILLRFYERMNLRAVGEALGTSENGAQKRVSRALEKLESLLKHRGITSTAVALSAVLSAGAVEAAPIGLAAQISAAALAAFGASAPAAVTATKLITMTTLQKALITTSIAVVATLGVYQARQTSRLHEQIRTLRQQQAPLAEQVDALQRERNQATNRLAWLVQELARTKHDSSELLRLRAEVTQLRANLRSAAKSSASPDSSEATLTSWLERVKVLKQSFEQWPGRKTPELQLLSDQDWLDATAQRTVDTDADRREVMSELRIRAKTRFAELVKKALQRYAEANNQQVPTAPSQLLPFFETPIDPAILEGYQIAAPGTVHPPVPGPAESQKAEVWAMVEKGDPADKEYDHAIVIYNGGAGWWSYGPSRKADGG